MIILRMQELLITIGSRPATLLVVLITLSRTRAIGVSPPSVPTGVSATNGTYADRVRVTWTAPSGATYYQVYRNTRRHQRSHPADCHHAQPI